MDPKEKFQALSKSRRYTLAREARKFIYENPGCANNNSPGGLSARQILNAHWEKIQKDKEDKEDKEG